MFLAFIDWYCGNVLIAASPDSAKWHLLDFTLSNARRFYSSMENPLGVKGLSDRNNDSACLHHEAIFM